MSPETETIDPLSDDCIEALYGIAYGLYKNGKVDEAEKCFKLLAIERPVNKKFWMGLGACYEAMRNYEKAIGCYSAVAIQDPLDPQIHWRAANCFHAQGDEEKALEALKSALEVASDSEEHKELVPSLKEFEAIWSQKLEARRNN